MKTEVLDLTESQYNFQLNYVFLSETSSCNPQRIFFNIGWMDKIFDKYVFKFLSSEKAFKH